MRYEDDEDINDFKDRIGLSNKPKKRVGFRDFLKWFFVVDFRDWTNYAAIALAAFLFWWGVKNIMKAMTMG